MNDDTTDGDSRPISRTAAFGILACVLPLALLFGPLLIALCEHLCFGTSHFEESLKRLGVHEFLGAVYEKTGLTDAIRRWSPR